MKKLLLTGFLLMLTGCETISGDQWRWMDDPSMQKWINVHIDGWGGEIRFSVPDRLNGSSNLLRASPSLGNGESSIQITYSFELREDNEDLAAFNWDYWWGGFFKGKGVDFFLDINIANYPDVEEFLELSPEEWIEWRYRYWKTVYSDPRMENGVFGKIFFEGYKVDQFRSQKSLVWVYENRPHLQKELAVYMTPVSENQVLMFSFFVNEESRNGLEPDPEWADRRWAMARKILDTVEITPRPGKF